MNKDTKEGLSTWVCGYVRLKGGEGPTDEAYDFLNAGTSTRASRPTWLRPGATAIPTWTAWPRSTRPCSRPRAMTTSSKFRDKTLFQSPMPPALRQRMIAEFEQIKAGF